VVVAHDAEFFVTVIFPVAVVKAMLSNVSTTVGPVQRWIGILSFLLTCDVLANVAYIFIPTYKVYLLVLACVTILCCILGLVVLLFLLMETRAFKAGYPGLICLKFSRVFIVDAIYLGLSVALLFILRVREPPPFFPPFFSVSPALSLNVLPPG
jgi:hypothetical protein